MTQPPGLLPSGFLDELRARLSLAQVVGRKVSWDARKTNAARGDYWAACPFHTEKSASFHVDDGKGFYYCFGCHAKGDAVTFVREIENVGFMDAVEILAREAGLALPARDPAAAARVEAQRGLHGAMEAAVRFYRLQLNGARAAGARSYLEQRGLSAETQARFELGYAPEGRTTLLQHLSGKGFPSEDLAEAGLVGLPDSGTPYDRFRDRLMFPIRDARGRAIAFGARALREGQEPKYLNSPETPLFDKGRSLYNIAPARSAAGQAGTVLVVEGYMDVIALAQAGLGHAVAPLGTAITEAQLRLIWRLSPEPVVALDGDRAGLRAAERLIDLALPLLGDGRGLRFVLLPGGQDPDDVVRSGGARAIADLVAASRPMIDLIWTRETAGAPLDSPERRAGLDGRLRAHLSRIADPSIRAHWQAEFRNRRAALYAPAGRGERSTRGPRPRAGFKLSATWPRAALPLAPTPQTKASLLAQRTTGSTGEARVRECAILLGCLNHPTLAPRFEERLERTAFLCPDLEEIRSALLSALAEPLHRAGGGKTTLLQVVAARLQRDPLAALTIAGQVRANPHLRPEAETARAMQAIDEELSRYTAWVGVLHEVRDAAQDLSHETADRITWRLKQATDAAHRASAQPLSTSEPETRLDSEGFAALMETISAQQALKKPPRR